jgi:glucosyl-dolichyl phosphate glucuronosyltransferase
MRVSVIIPTRNRPIELGHLLWSLVWQRHWPTEIIIVDQSDTDRTAQVVDSFMSLCKATHGNAPELVYRHDRAIRGASPARNVGVALASGDILLFLDDDEILENDFIHELLNVYASDPSIGGVSGVVTNYPLPSLGLRIIGRIFWRGPFRDERQPIYWNADQLRLGEPVEVTKFGSGVMSVRRSVLATDRFDDSLEGLPPGEDVDLCCRLAARTRLVITPRARLINLMSSTGRARPHWLETDAQATHYLYRRNWRSGVKNRLAFAWLHVGYLIFAAAASLRRRSRDPWRALQEGIRRGRGQKS